MSDSSLKQRWAALPPNARTAIAVGGLAGSLILVAMALGVGSTRTTAARVEPPSVTNMVMPTRREGSVEQVVGRVDATQDQIKQLQAELQRGAEERSTLMRRIEEIGGESSRSRAGSDVGKELLAMSQRLDTIERQKADLEKKAAASKLDQPLPGADSPATTSTPASQERSRPSLQVIGGSAAANATPAPVAEKPPLASLPAGSFFEAVLLNGMDAPTSQVTQKNPVPSLLRVKTDAILPNQYRQDVKECFVIVSGHGVLATERVSLRTETLSCIRENGKTLETKLDGYVVGEDGKVGMRGRLVSKQGQMIAKSLVAGFFSGAARALTPTSIPQLSLSSNSMSQTSSTPMDTALESGTYQGFAESSKMIAKFYLDMAKEMFPVVEVDAARKVTIVLIKGFELKE